MTARQLHIMAAAMPHANPPSPCCLVFTLQTHTRVRSHGLVVLELFAGSATHSAILCAVMHNNLKGANVSCVSVDICSSLDSTIKGDMRVWNSSHTAALKSRFPLRCFLVHASPPCTEYSVANTTAERPLEERLLEADQLVAIVFAIYRDLGSSALLMTVENPGTGRLVGREVGSKEEGRGVLAV